MINSIQRRLNLAAELRSSVANGPGLRYVIWVQGCSLRCRGCFNEAFQPFISNRIVDIDSLAEKILSVDGIEGVTYSGGEPMLQAKPLYHLSSFLKQHGLTIVCYTGFTFDELSQLKDPYVNKLISALDILIDGPYEEDKKSNLLWRGSSNQKVHFLTDAYLSYKSTLETNISEMEIVFGSEGMTITGTIQKEIMQKLAYMRMNEE
jgi:anaerobic ribonucleoside-triphosphate reductase activating protein